MKINMGKITDRMKLENISNIRLLPDSFKPEKKHFHASIGLTVLYAIIGIICMASSLLDGSKGYLKIVAVFMFILVTIFILMTLEIQKRLKQNIIG